MWSAVLTLLALNVGLGVYAYMHPNFRDPVFDLKARAMEKHFDQPGDPFRVIVLGSSRAAAAVEPAVLETTLTSEIGRPVAAFNMAMQGDGPIGQLIHLRRILASGVKPDVVVVELLPSTFLFGDRPYDFSVLRPERLRYDEIDVVVKYGYPEAATRKEWREATLNPWFGTRFQLLARVQRLWLPTGVVTYQKDAGKLGGWNPWAAYPPHLYRQRVNEVKQTYEPQLQALKFSGPQMAALDGLLAECKTANVRVAVVIPPEGSEFRSWYPDRVVEELKALTDRLRMTHGVLIVDARQWLPDEAFADSHHVIRQWAKPYTERLVREVIVPAKR